MPTKLLNTSYLRLIPKMSDCMSASIMALAISTADQRERIAASLSPEETHRLLNSIYGDEQKTVKKFWDQLESGQPLDLAAASPKDNLVFTDEVLMRRLRGTRKQK
jgi:hypothetical protein